MLMNKSLLFYTLSVVGRQQASNGRKANLFIPQIRIYIPRRTKCSQHCQGPGHNPPSSRGSHQSWSHGDAPGSLHWSLPSSPSQNPFGFVSYFPWASLSACPHPLSTLWTSNIQHQLSSKSWCSQTPPWRAREDYWEDQWLCVWYSVREKCRGDGRWGHNTGTGNHAASRGRSTWSWQRWHFGAPQRSCACSRSRSCGGRGAERAGSCRARGLAHTGAFALPWLLTFHLLQRVCWVNVYFAVWWLILHPAPLISVHLTVRLLNNLLHKWVSIPACSPISPGEGNA